MEYSKYKTFNLNEHIPQVLLIGNGLVRHGENSKWEDAISKIASYGNVDCEDFKEKQQKIKNAPYPIQSTIMLDPCEEKRNEQYYNYFEEKYCYLETYDYISRLLKLKFDAILTTNYTYEIEKCLDPKFATKPSKANVRCSYCTFPNDGKISTKERYINIYNSILEHDIWHIHGEIRRKSSLIFTHDEYIEQLRYILNYNSNCNNCLEFKSWIDYFVFGDVYVLGFGMNFSEIDLWWLLNRKRIEKTETGNVYFYAPIEENKSNESIVNAIKMLGFETNNLNTTIHNSNFSNNRIVDGEYDEFYNKAIDDISERINQNQGNLCLI
jgi:hypothetical protein